MTCAACALAHDINKGLSDLKLVGLPSLPRNFSRNYVQFLLEVECLILIVGLVKAGGVKCFIHFVIVEFQDTSN